MMSPKSCRFQCTDFKVTDLLKAVRRIQGQKRTGDNTGEYEPSPAMVAFEGLLTTCMADETEWAAGWAKMLRWTMSHGEMPDTFALLELEVPRQFTYMLSAKLDPDMQSPCAVETVKIECDGEDPDAGRQDGGQSNKLASVRQPL